MIRGWRREEAPGYMEMEGVVIAHLRKVGEARLVGPAERAIRYLSASETDLSAFECVTLGTGIIGVQLMMILKDESWVEFTFRPHRKARCCAAGPSVPMISRRVAGAADFANLLGAFRNGHDLPTAPRKGDGPDRRYRPG